VSRRSLEQGERVLIEHTVSNLERKRTRRERKLAVCIMQRSKERRSTFSLPTLDVRAAPCIDPLAGQTVADDPVRRGTDELDCRAMLSVAVESQGEEEDGLFTLWVHGDEDLSKEDSSWSERRGESRLDAVGEQRGHTAQLGRRERRRRATWHSLRPTSNATQRKRA
jgi:hypothetical protein